MKHRRRHLVILGSAFAHAAVVAAFLLNPARPSAVAETSAINVSLFDGKALLASQKPPAPPSPPAPRRPPAFTAAKLDRPLPQPTDIEPQYVEVHDTEPELLERDPLQDPVALSVAAAAAASGQACQLTSWLQTALQNDPQVQTALSLIPRPAKSVANAVMIWDGGWVDAPRGASVGVGAVRMALLSGIRSAPAACQTQTIRGPELMTLANGADTTVLAVGAGQWRWIDLVATAGTAPNA